MAADKCIRHQNPSIVPVLQETTFIFIENMGTPTCISHLTDIDIKIVTDDRYNYAFVLTTKKVNSNKIYLFLEKLLCTEGLK